MPLRGFEPRFHGPQPCVLSRLYYKGIYIRDFQGLIKVFSQKFCSKECRNKRIESQKEITYFDIFQRDEFRCQYCGKTPKDGIKLIVEHIYPVSKGGGADSFNLITSCERCNANKGQKLFPLQLILDLWKNNECSFTYKEAKEFFENKLQQRKRRLKKRR